jgi:hypothetical protein
MAKSAPVGSDFHEDKIESRPSESVGNQKKIVEGEQTGSPGSVPDPAAESLGAAKRRKVTKRKRG